MPPPANVALVRVPFYEDTLEAIHHEDKILVHFKSVCEALGVKEQAQLRKLSTREWCILVDLMAPDQLGRMQRLTAIDIECPPLWLATINPISVRQETKAKLIRYQREARSVLSAWFLGTSADRPDLAKEFAEVKATLLETQKTVRSQGVMLTTLHDAFMATRTENEILSAHLGEPAGIFMSLREYCTRFRVCNNGVRLTGTEMRVISRKLGKISKAMKIEVRTVPSEFWKSVKAYRVDLLHDWRGFYRMRARLATATFPHLNGCLTG